MGDSLYITSEAFDVLHYSITLDLTSTFSSKKRIFDGKAELIIKPKTDTLNTLGIDAAKLKIDSVMINGREQDFLLSEEMLFVDLDESYGRDDTVVVSIYYKKTEENAEDKGFYYHDKSDVTAEQLVYTNSYQNNTKYWLPCVDDLRDKATVDLRVRVPDGYTVLSNGVLYKKETTGAADVFFFRNDLPISSYCISLAVSRFQHTSQNLSINNDTISIYFWEKDSANSSNVLSKFKDIYETYIDLFGFCPFPGLKFLLVKPFIYTAYSAPALIFIDRLKPPADSSFEQMLYSHEIGHQWFGSCVNLKEWNDILSDEDFAGYWSKFYQGEIYGEEFLKRQVKRARSVGVFQMLQYIIGRNMFLKAFKDYLHKYAYSNASSDDFFNQVNETAGTEYKWFFNEWFINSDIPVYNISWDYNSDVKILNLTIEQTQNEQGIFTMPVEILISTTEKDTTVNILNSSRIQKFQIGITGTPLKVIFDPQNKILIKKVNIISDVQDHAAVSGFNLSQNYPNPFNPVTVISYELSEENDVWLVVYDQLGREVKRVVDEFKRPGRYETEFDGSGFASGVYVYVLRAGEHVLCRKMILMK